MLSGKDNPLSNQNRYTEEKIVTSEQRKRDGGINVHARTKVLCGWWFKYLLRCPVVLVNRTVKRGRVWKTQKKTTMRAR